MPDLVIFGQDEEREVDGHVSSRQPVRMLSDSDSVLNENRGLRRTDPHEQVSGFPVPRCGTRTIRSYRSAAWPDTSQAQEVFGCAHVLSAFRDCSRF